MSSADHVATAEGSRESRLFEEVFRSKCFERTRGLRKLLQYLWMNRENDVSEYAIAIDALGRGADFDSRVDAVVRVQIGRLRRQLDRYYETEGRSADRRIIIPLGSHRLEWIDVQSAAADQEDEDDGSTALTVTSAVPAPYSIAPVPEKTSGWPVREISLAVVVILACIAVTTTSLVLWKSHSSVRVAGVRNDSPLFWKQFFDNGKPTRIVLPAPLFFAWNPKDSASLMVRDISVNDFDHPQTSPELVNIEKRLGKPARWQNYTVASDTFAALKLARFLDKYGIQTSFSSSQDFPHEITDHENIIAFGTVTSMAAFRPELDSLSFRMGPHERFIVDTRMPAGSPPPFRMVFEPNERTVVPEIMALLPRGSSGSRILLLQGEQTTALISYLISEEGMRELSKAMQGIKSPFFEAVILAEVNGNDPIQSRLAAFRAFPVPPSGSRQQPAAPQTTLALEHGSLPLSPTK